MNKYDGHCQNFIIREKKSHKNSAVCSLLISCFLGHFVISIRSDFFFNLTGLTNWHRLIESKLINQKYALNHVVILMHDESTPCNFYIISWIIWGTCEEYL